MIDHTTALYCIVDDLLKAIGHKDDCRRELTDAEVITAARRADFARVVRAGHSATDFQYLIKGARRQVKGAWSRTRVTSRSWVSKS